MDVNIWVSTKLSEPGSLFLKKKGPTKGRKMLDTTPLKKKKGTIG